MHPHSSSVRPARFVLAALLLAGLPASAAAQTATPERAPQVESGQATLLARDAEETRSDLYEVLGQYPPSLGRVLRLDPTLMTNEVYLSSYPNLAAFVARNPDVPRNPDYYLHRFAADYGRMEPEDARQAAVRMWGDALEFLGAFAIFCVVMFVFYSLVKYIVEYRRWHRISRVNAEVHNKILDRFASNEELLAYVESPAGRRFLEAAPIIPTEAPVRSAGAPFARILLSVQVGVILLALAIGFLFVSNRAVEEVQPMMTSISVLGLCLGIGSIVSAVASYALSRKLGLLPEPDARPERTV